jgi:uncharacterized protein YlbG (UPF0298 family)
MDNQEKDFLDDIDVKPKKQLSEQKLQHLANIRVKALEKKKEMKEISDKVNKLKQLESIKQVKQIQKEQLAKQYDEMVANAKPKEEEEKENIKPKEEEIKKDEIKPIKKKRIIKKIVYQEASSSDSESADEVEIVKVKKNQSKKKETIEKPQPQQQNINNNSYSNLLYESSVDKLKSRMMDERAKMLIMSIMPSYC